MACPVCGAARQVPAAEVAGRPLLICGDCRHVNWAEMPTDAELTAYYSSAYTEMHGQNALQASHTEYYRGHAEELARLVQRPVQEMAIADVGCSIPVFLEQAVAVGCTRAIGVDWSEEARAYGAARGVDVVTPDAFLAEVPDGSLDVLRYSHVLEHLPDPLGVLRAQVVKLKPGGLLYITQPNLPMLRAGEIPAPFDNTYPTHLQFFTPASLIRLVEAAGCAVERFFTVGDPEQHVAQHGAWFDLGAARVGCAATAGRGEPLRGLLNNYPFHFGRNAGIHARAGATAAPVPKLRGGDALCGLLADVAGEGALAYAAGPGDAGATSLIEAGFARVVTFGEGAPPATSGIESTGRAAGAEAGTTILGHIREPGTLRQIDTVTLDAHARQQGEVPSLIRVTGAAPAVLAGAAGLIERARPVLCFPMRDTDIPLVRLLTAGHYDLLRVADWSPGLEPRAEPTGSAELVIALPKP